MSGTIVVAGRAQRNPGRQRSTTAKYGIALKNKRLTLALFTVLSTATVFLTTPLHAQNTAPTSALLTTEGKVEVMTSAAPGWQPGQTNQTLNIGDRVRTGLRSRATLRLADQTVLRVNELTLLEIRPTAADPKRAGLDLKSGSTYFFNRGRPTDTDFRTPVASGAIRGTEFHLAVAKDDGRTVLTLLDGEVALNNAEGDLALASGEQATVEPGQPPRKTAVLDVTSIIQWCLYYPAILDLEDVRLDQATRTALADSLAAYRSGDLLGALSLYPETRTPASDNERVYHAALLLSVGQVAEAGRVLDSMQSGSLQPGAPASSAALDGRTSKAGEDASAPNTSSARRGSRTRNSASAAAALRRLIATVKGQDAKSDRTPATTTEWMAESYFQQSKSELHLALEAARTAAMQSPQFGFAAVRVAELEFSLGNTEAALSELTRGLALSPRNAQALALRGFLLSAQNNSSAAFAAFDQAIATDGALGNAWIGRGLVRIRQGDRRGGLADLQVAATLEPKRAALRSYLGKAYSHAWDNARARKELALARQMDPNDPTAWLYAALVEQEENQPNTAVRDLEQSKALNNNRSVYRSSVLLDQDRSVRSANLASMYRDAGMSDVGVREASRAVNYDYANYSAHLFLANSYDAIRDPKLINLRYETPWLSELLLANLLAPVGAVSLSRNISQQEYSRFFEGNRIGLSSSTEYFSSGDWAQRGSQFGTLGNSSYALDVDYRTENGQRPNNDFERLTLSGMFKQQLTPEDSLFVQVLGSGGDSGDLAQYYDQGNASGTQRVKEIQAANVFVGYHHEWDPGSHTLVLAGRLDDEFRFRGQSRINNLTRDAFGEVTGGFGSLYAVDYESDFYAYTAELQHILDRGPHSFIVGARHQSGRNETVAISPTAQDIESDLERSTIYGYYHWQIFEPLKLMAGLSYDYLDFPENNDLAPFSSAQRTEEQVSPKAGFYYTPLKDTTIRGAYTRSLGGLFYDGSVRLEPTQVGGFNQAFRSVIPESVVGLVPGSEFETFGLALDQNFATGTYVTIAAEQLNSSARRSIGAFDLQFLGPAIPSSIPDRIEFEERSLTLSLHQLIGKHWSFGASYRVTDADLSEHTSGLTPGLAAAMDRDWEATLHQVQLGGTLNLPCGFFASAGAVWSQQSNRGYSPDIPGDDFWHFNAYLGYRFLKRHAEVRLGLLNIGDTDYRLNPLTLYSELPRERTLAARFQFAF